jgi:SAM-dependent methyltransferase
MDIPAMADSFDAPAYLRANPDVGKAVEEGRVRSAWSHFVSHGFREKRAGVPEAVLAKVEAVMNAPADHPPAKLISRVHGTSETAGFEQVGRTVALDIYAAAAAHIDLDRPLRILDFGCGCGRVLRYMGEIAPASTIDASDIDGEAIGWCEGNFQGEVRRGRFTFTVNRDHPPTPFDSDTFDLVYAISVFTHLPEDLQLQWLGELSRVTRPGGIAVLSAQGGALIRKHLTPGDSRLFDAKGFHYFPYGGTEGLPDYYQAAWHDRSYIDRVWSRYFEILEQVPGGVADHQDLILCRKRPSSA